MQRSTHAQQLERWLGPEQVANIEHGMRGWYGPPIAVAQTPDGSRIFARDGDFIGQIKGGGFAGLLDRTHERVKRIARRVQAIQEREAEQLVAHAGFTSLSDLIAEASVGGKRYEYMFSKTGTLGVVAATNSLWLVGSQPAAGAAGAAAPGGTAHTDASTGGFPFTNPGGTDTQHFVSGFPVASVAANTLLLYDRLFSVAKTMNSTATEAVTGVPTRYQSAVGGAADSIEGNFLFMECGTVLPATAHNWTVCTYTDQSNTAGASLPSVTGNSANLANRLDMPASSWFCPLATDDTGIRNLTQMQCSALVATGTINFVIGHPIAWMPCPVANMVCVADGLNSAFNLARIFNDACLAFLEVCKPATTATTYTGSFTGIAG